MPEPVTLRPRGGMIIAVAALVIAVAALVFIAVDGGLLELVRWAWPVVLLGWGAWLVYLRPFVRVSEGFVEVSNIVRTDGWWMIASASASGSLTPESERNTPNYRAKRGFIRNVCKIANGDRPTHPPAS